GWPVPAVDRFVAVSAVSSQSPPSRRRGWVCSAAIPFASRHPVIKSFFFVLRLAAAWFLAVLLVLLMWTELPLLGRLQWPLVLLGMATMALVFAGALSHLRRVRLIAGHVDKTVLSNRQRRQVEIPFEAGEAFDLVEAAVRELPRVEQVEAARDSLQLRARVGRPQTYGVHPLGRWTPLLWFGIPSDQSLATVSPGHDGGSVTLICEPESPAWSDWCLVDDGANYGNAAAITCANSRRVAEHRRGEKAAAVQTA